MTHSCRHCGAALEKEVIDLGHQPPSNAYLKAEQLLLQEITYPLKVYLCTSCWLMQLPAHAPAEQLFASDYAYFSSTSASWCDHAARFVDHACKRLALGENSLVVELASNDGYLLQYVKQHSVPCLGIEPTKATADAARARGIPTIERFFGTELALQLLQDGYQADLIVANNVLAHVPDINDFLEGISILLKPGGVVSIEFPHLQRLIAGNQFDTIYHEHYSYLSLSTVERMAATVGLHCVDVEELPTHGGSLRVWLAHEEWQGGVDPESLARIRQGESVAGLEQLEAYEGFQQRALSAKLELLEFLLACRKAGRRVLGYGAAAKGNTLLNYAGIKADLLEAVADLAPSKVGTWLPGSHIPVISVKDFLNRRPDDILILPWNIAGEVQTQLQGLVTGNLHRAIPTMERL